MLLKVTVQSMKFHALEVQVEDEVRWYEKHFPALDTLWTTAACRALLSRRTVSASVDETTRRLGYITLWTHSVVFGQVGSVGGRGRSRGGRFGALPPLLGVARTSAIQVNQASFRIVGPSHGLRVNEVSSVLCNHRAFSYMNLRRRLWCRKSVTAVTYSSRKNQDADSLRSWTIVWSTKVRFDQVDWLLLLLSTHHFIYNASIIQ